MVSDWVKLICKWSRIAFKKNDFRRKIADFRRKIVFFKCNLWPLPNKFDPIWNHIIKDFCLNFMKMVNKSCLAQQMTEKIAVEVDAKNRFWKKCKNLQVFYLMMMLKAFLFIQESFMTWSEDWKMAFRYLTLPRKHCICQNLLQREYKP